MAKNLSIRFSAASSAAAISSSSGSGNTPSAPSVPPFDELPADGGGSTASVVTTNTVIAAAVAVAPTTTAPLASASASPTAVASSGSESSSSSSPVTVHSASAASADIDIIQLSAEVKKGSGGGGAAAVSSAQTWPTLSCDSTAPTGDRARPNGHDYVTVANSRSAPSASGEGSSTATTTTLSSSMSRSSSTTAAATTTKESPDKDETISPVNTPQQQPSVIANSSGKNSSNPNRSSSSNKSSPTVGSKVDRFVRQLQESFTSSSSSSKAEPPTATMSWCKFAKGAEGVGGSGAALEIISQSAAESDDSLLSRERVSITLTPAAATAAPSPPNHTASTMTTSSTSSSKSPSAASAAYNSWLADMKTFKEKWSKTEKAEKNSKSGGDEFPSTLSSSRSSSTLVTTSSTATTSSTTPSSPSSSSSVTVSNAYLNNNYTLVNNNSSHVCTGSTCSACSAARRTVSQSTVQAPSTLPVQSFTGSSVYCATCLTTTNSDHQHQHHQHHHHQHQHHHHHHHQQQSNSKSNAINSNATPQRTPTPPLLLSPNEVVFDPNFDPYLVGETSRDNNNMIFSFGRSSSSSEKKEKKDKDKEGKSGRAKLFTGSSSSQSKEKDAAAVAAAAKKKSKEKERDKEKDKDKDTSNSFFKINTSRSSSVSSPTSANISSSNLTTSFLLGFSKNSSSPSHSRYSSQENISINSDNLNWSKNSNNNNNNIPKSSSASSKQLSSSRSMISFRKLTKNGENESEVTFEDLDLSTTYDQDTRNSFGPQPSNPTLRRKADSFRRNDSPTTTTTTTTTESGGHFSLLDGDTMSMASSKSSNSNSSASALFHRSHSISTADLSSLGTPSELQPARSPTARQRISQLSHAVLPSSWATCIAYAYYIFALVVALLSLLISLISPLPAFFNGLVLGFVCTFLLVTVVIIYIVSHYVLVKSPDSDEEKPSGLLRSQLSGESISLKRSLNRPKLSTNSLITTASGTAVEPDLYSGWVYEFIGEYEEREKNGFLSQLVHVVLRGTRLTIYTPATELNEKKLKALLAAENSSVGGSGSSSSGSGSSSSKAQPGVTFASQRVIEFSRQSRKPRVSLLLTKNVRNQRKYVWSKKYPVCLEFVDDRATSGGGYIVVGKSNDEAAPPLRGGSSSSNESSSSLVDAATIPLQTTTPFSTTSSSASPVPLKLVLFARSCREKEEWFWAMKMAVDMASKGGSTDVSPKSSNLNIADSTTQLLTTTTTTTITSTTSEQTEDFSSGSAQQYLRILTRRLNYSAFMRANVLSGEGGGGGLGASGMHQNPLTWFNVLLNRLSFDILNKPNWSAYIAKKLQRKLRKLRLPYFMESLTITEIDIGTTLPKFNSVPTPPVVDDAGLWIDFDVSYSGGFTMTLETKLNLMKLKKAESTAAVESISLSTLSAAESGRHSSGVNTPTGLESPLVSPTAANLPKQMKHWCGYKFRTSTVSSVASNASNSGAAAGAGTGASGANDETAASVDSDSDLDSIGTSSEDEEPETAPADPDDADTDEKQRKLIRFVNKIASSQYFQKATQINFFKKAIEGVSKMSIMLTVQINSLSGILAINIPESPSDRLWYGFRNDPTFQITARPKVGDHDLNLHYVTNFIEKKLRAEFFNYFVIPHMDDFYIPALNANIEQYVSVVP